MEKQAENDNSEIIDNRIPDDKRAFAELDPDLKKEVHKIAIDRGVSLKTVMDEIVTKYLKKNN